MLRGKGREEKRREAEQRDKKRREAERRVENRVEEKKREEKRQVGKRVGRKRSRRMRKKANEDGVGFGCSGIAQHNIAKYTVQCNAVQYSTVQCSAVQYSTVRFTQHSSVYRVLRCRFRPCRWLLWRCPLPVCALRARHLGRLGAALSTHGSYHRLMDRSGEVR